MVMDLLLPLILLFFHARPTVGSVHQWAWELWELQRGRVGMGRWYLGLLTSGYVLIRQTNS